MKFAPPPHSSAAYRFAHRLLSVLIPLVCRLRVEGREHVPLAGGCVVACNHSLGFDFFFLGYCAPRQIFFMAKAEAFAGNQWLARFLKSAGVFPIERGQRDSAALDAAVSLAQSGSAVGMFPEGTRSRTGVLMRGRSGAVRIARQAAVPIVPAAIHNAAAILDAWWNPFQRPIVTVRFGPPLEVAPQDSAAEASTSAAATSVAADVARVMYSIAALLPPALRGEYAQPPT